MLGPRALANMPACLCGVCADKKRAAEREDDDLDEEGVKDPWLLQAAQDAARAKDAGDSAASYLSRAGKPLQSSTAALAANENAPPFDQGKARLILLKHMKPGETVQKAVRRLGTSAAAPGGAAAAPAKNKMKNVRSKPKEGAAAPAAATPLDAAAEKQRKADFAELTDAAQGFLNSGYVGQWKTQQAATELLSPARLPAVCSLASVSA